MLFALIFVIKERYTRIQKQTVCKATKEIWQFVHKFANVTS